jgi:inner membrane protein
VLAQAQATRVAEQALAARRIPAQQLLVTPTAFNTVLWRVVAVDGDHYYEGFYSLLDAVPDVVFDRFPRGVALAGELAGDARVQRLSAFAKGFYKLREEAGRVFVTDLRMGQEPRYIFDFAVAQRHSALKALQPPEQLAARIDLARGLPWLWRRMWGEVLPPPR